MTSAAARWMVLVVTIATGLAGCGGHGRQSHTETTLSAYAPTVAANDSFAGHIVHATGRLAGAGNSVQLRLHADERAGTRKLSVSISSSSCRGRPHCLALAGKLSGTLVRKPSLPDLGRTFAISASGTVTPLGRASGSGTVTGTGNIRFGREQLHLTLAGQAGQVTISAQSAQVPGFTSP